MPLGNADLASNGWGPHCGHHPQKPILDKVTVRALTRISQAGCGTSMIFLAFSIVLYALLRSVTLIPTPHLSLALKGGIGAG